MALIVFSSQVLNAQRIVDSRFSHGFRTNNDDETSQGDWQRAYDNFSKLAQNKTYIDDMGGLENASYIVRLVRARFNEIDKNKDQRLTSNEITTFFNITKYGVVSDVLPDNVGTTAEYEEDLQKFKKRARLGR